MSWVKPWFWALCLSGLAMCLCAGASPSSSTGTWGTNLTFHGWSQDSTYVAYTRKRTLRDRRARRGAKVTVRHAHRRVSDGVLQPFGARFGKDAGRHARRSGYILEPAPLVEEAPYERRFETSEGTYVFRLHVGEDLRWELLWQDQVLLERPFDTLYVGVRAEIYPSPDRRQVALVLHLDSGWLVDGGFYVAQLPPGARTRWQVSALVGPPSLGPQ